MSLDLPQLTNISFTGNALQGDDQYHDQNRYQNELIMKSKLKLNRMLVEPHHVDLPKLNKIQCAEDCNEVHQYIGVVELESMLLCNSSFMNDRDSKSPNG